MPYNSTCNYVHMYVHMSTPVRTLAIFKSYDGFLVASNTLLQQLTDKEKENTELVNAYVFLMCISQCSV